VLLIGAWRVGAQAFVNLNFESGLIPPGTQPASLLPISTALRGWTGYFIDNTGVSNAATQVVYDGYSAGGAFISINDANTIGGGFVPLQGKYSAVLFGGGSNPTYSTAISQTGLVPDGTESLQVQVEALNGPFIVTLGGETINMLPLSVFPTYTLYGGDISQFADMTETLTFTEPPPASSPPSILVLDNILFSTSPVPEPGTMTLVVAGAVLLGLRQRCNGGGAKVAIGAAPPTPSA
jgi:hypothetical protein